MQARHYQQDAIQAGTCSPNGVLVLPTGSGKSVVCAGLVNALDGATLVLQPTIEILESNIEKVRMFGIMPAVYSASAGSKQVGDVTYATIGSVINCLDKFRHVRNLLIDECHLVNAKGGMYETLIRELAPEHLIGMTATPYRLATSSFGAAMRIIVRTRPKIFDAILHVTNPRELVAEGFLLNPNFITVDNDTSMLRPNTTGAEFSEASAAAFARKNDIKQKIVDLLRTVDHKHILVFAESVADSQWIAAQLNKHGIRASEINANTHKRVRAEELGQYKDGEIRVMVNVGTLTTGYDFPALDCIIDGNPTMSAALHYQKIGRVVRPFPGKSPVVYDLAGNHARLGNPLNYTMVKNSSGLYEVYSEKGRITTRSMSDGPESETEMTFGKYRGHALADVDDNYLEWAVAEFKGERKHMFYAEIVRRQLFGQQAAA